METISQQERDTIQEQSNRLKSRFADSDKKRQDNMNRKLRLYRLNDEKWQQKMGDIDKKLKNLSRDAINRAKEYRDRSEQYWENKKKDSSHITSRPQASLSNIRTSQASDSHYQQCSRPQHHYLYQLPEELRSSDIRKVRRDPSKTIDDG